MSTFCGRPQIWIGVGHPRIHLRSVFPWSNPRIRARIFIFWCPYHLHHHCFGWRLHVCVSWILEVLQDSCLDFQMRFDPRWSTPIWTLFHWISKHRSRYVLMSCDSHLWVRHLKSSNCLWQEWAHNPLLHGWGSWMDGIRREASSGFARLPEHFGASSSYVLQKCGQGSTG